MKKLDQLVQLRLLIQYLGEKEQYNWWACSFFNSFSGSFLNPLFPRSAFLSRYHGSLNAAMKIHDAHIGKGKVYHLFRLPDILEKDLHQTLITSNSTENSIKEWTKDIAFKKLLELSDKEVNAISGPQDIGLISTISRSETISKIAGLYASAFKNNIKCYPFMNEAE